MTATSVDDLLNLVSLQDLTVPILKFLISLEIRRGEFLCKRQIREGWTQSSYRIRAHGKAGEKDEFVHLWYHRFLELAFEGTTWSSFNQDMRDVLGSINIITFNYDRSFEYYILQFCQRRFPQISSEDLQQFLSKFLKIHHVYGSVNPDPPERRITNLISDFGANKGDIGEEEVIKRALSSSKSILTIGEAKQNLNDLDSAKNAMMASKNLLFVGNSFIRENIDLFALNNNDRMLEARIYGTAFGLSDEIVTEVRQKLLQCLLQQQMWSVTSPAIRRDWDALRLIDDVGALL